MTAAYILLGGLGLLFAVAIGFSVYWGISSELIWASRIRRLLEHEAFNFNAGYLQATSHRRWPLETK